jgi:ribulose-phosphate 3-epimerase
MTEKIATLRRWRDEQGQTWRLEVDGGVDLQTAPLCHAAGADTFVAGTAFFKAPDRMDFLRKVSALAGD